MRRYQVKKYIRVKNGKLVDTTLLLPHVECYFVEEGKLYFENIDGTEMYLGTIVAESDDLKDLIKEQFI